MRFLPRNHDDVNEEWISDKTRFVWDGLKTQRLDQPFVRTRGKLRPATWDEAFAAITKRLNKAKGKRIAALAGDWLRRAISIRRLPHRCLHPWSGTSVSKAKTRPVPQVRV